MRLVFGILILIAAASASAGELTDFSGSMVAIGPKEEWKLNITPGHKMMFSAGSEDSQTESPAVKPAAKNGGVVEFASGKIMAAFKRTDACKLDARGPTYPFETTVTAKGKTYSGCGYANWDRNILELMPAIDACLKSAKSKGPVTFAAREGDGPTIRIASKGDATTICHIDDTHGAPKVAKLEKNKHVPRLAGERDPLFYRAPAKNPGGECYEAEKVIDKSGKFLGWTDTDEGC